MIGHSGAGVYPILALQSTECLLADQVRFAFGSAELPAAARCSIFHLLKFLPAGQKFQQEKRKVPHCRRPESYYVSVHKE
jgi:hypothetical protein